MDFGFYKRARGIKQHRAAATPFYPARKPVQVAPAAAQAAQQPAGVRAKQPATITVWSLPAPAPAAVVSMELVDDNGAAPGASSDADVDRRAALYISRVQERLRRERMTDDWRKYY